MTDPGNPTKWFYRCARTNAEHGPFDLVEMAGFLMAAEITAETPTRAADDESWQPFGARREFAIAKEIPPGIVMRHLDRKADEAQASRFTWKKLGYFFYFLGGFLLYVIGKMDLTKREGHWVVQFIFGPHGGN